MPPKTYNPSLTTSRGYSLLPAAIVPIVGSFSNNQTHAWLGYERIKDQIASCKCHTAALLTRRPSDILKRLTPELADKLRREACHPIPVPVDENGTRSFFPQAWLTQLLPHVEIVAVISAGQTTTTLRLLEMLHPYNVPICITVASVDSLLVHSLAGGQDQVPYRNLLRLNPSNDQQAQALVARVRSLLDAGIPRSRDADEQSPPKDFTLVTSDPNNDYCRDLARAIRRQAALTHPKLTLIDLQTTSFDQLPEEGIVVYVGYANQLQHFSSHWGQYRGVITSDGFSEADLAKHIRETKGDRTRFYVCQSSTPPPVLIQHAYEAIRASWKESQGSASRRRDPETPLAEFTEHVKEHLQTGPGEGEHYQFLGHQNLRSTYFVRRLT
jgi:hypothetical protein